MVHTPMQTGNGREAPHLEDGRTSRFEDYQSINERCDVSNPKSFKVCTEKCSRVAGLDDDGSGE